MIERRVTKRYVSGLLEVARQQGRIDEVEQGLQALARLIRASDEVRQLLCHPTVSRRAKKRMLLTLLEGRLDEQVCRFVEYVVDKKRERILEWAFEVYKESADQMRGIVRGRVRSMATLSPEQARRLREQLSQTIGKKVELDFQTDRSLLGGMQVFIGSYIVDGSITGRMNRLQKHLLEEVSRTKSAA